MRGDDDLNTPMIALTAVAFVILTAAVIVILQTMFYKMSEDENFRKVISHKPEQLTALTIEQQSQLNSYGWLDSKNGIVHIPIDLAMELTAKELSSE